MISFENIKVKSPYNIKIVEDIKIDHKINEHGKLYLKGIVEEETEFNNTINAKLEDEIHIYKSDEKDKITIFKGLVSNIKTTNVNKIYYVEIEAISGSIKLDIKKKSRSFQDINMVYTQLIKEITKDYSDINFINTIKEGTKIEKPVIQYKETDWELLKRLSSKFNKIIVCDIMEKSPRIYFGLPEGKARALVNTNIPYTASKDLLSYKKAINEEEDIHDTDFFYYEIESREQFQIGDKLTFRKKEMHISEIEGYIDKGILKYKYKLSRKKGIRQQRIYNKEIKGASLEGKVLDVKNELIKLHLKIDEKQSKEKAYWFPFIPETGNIMYCMPQIGTYTNLYIPDKTGKNGKVLGCIRKNGQDCEKTSDTNNRYLGTEHGSELEITPTAINIVSGNKEPLKITMDDKTGVSLTSHKKLTLNADGEISLYTPKKITIKASSQLIAKKTSVLSGVSIESEYDLLGANVILEGEDRETYPPFDDEPQKGTPNKTNYQKVNKETKKEEKKGFNWGKLALNVLGGIAVVAAVTAAAVLTVATLGAGAAVIGAVAVCGVIGGTAAVASQAVSDIRKGEVSDFSDYAAAAARETIVGAVSGAVFGPLGPAATMKGKMAIAATSNAIESCIRQKLQGRKINLKEVGLDAGIGIITAGIIDSRLGKGIGETIDKVAPWIKKGTNKVFDSISGVANKVGKVGNEIGEGILENISNKINPSRVLVTPDGTPIRVGKENIGINIGKDINTNNIHNFDANSNGKNLTKEVSKANLEVKPFNESGKLKPNIKYKAGEYDYLHKTDEMGRISKFETDNLKLTERGGRLPHNPDTPGKLAGDHAGHLAGDRFGGSPELDNLVSQSSNVNLSQYKKIENQWATAIKEGKPVKVNVEVKYDGNGLRPSEFNVKYEIDGKRYRQSILN